jgi:hypothetical protein
MPSGTVGLLNAFVSRMPGAITSYPDSHGIHPGGTEGK